MPKCAKFADISQSVSCTVYLKLPLRTTNSIKCSTPVRRDLGEEECQVLRHWVWLVRGGEEPIGLQAPVLVVLLNGQHLVVALGNACSVRIPLARQSILQRSNFVVVLVLLLKLLKIFFVWVALVARTAMTSASCCSTHTKLLKILICSIEDRCLAVGGLAQERGTCRHGHTGN